MWHLKDPKVHSVRSGHIKYHSKIMEANNIIKDSLCTDFSFLLIISPLKGAILLQHVKRLQLFHNIITLGNPFLSLFWRKILVPQECSMTAIPEICVTLRIFLAQVEQGPVQSHHPHFLTGHCHAGKKQYLALVEVNQAIK